MSSTDELPADRVALRSRGIFLVAVGVGASAFGLAMLTGHWEVSDTGWTGVIPDSLHPVIAMALVLIGLCCAAPSLLWMLVPLRGPRPAVVHFAPNHIEIRSSLFPRTFVVERASVLEVHLLTGSKVILPSFGLAPMVVLRTADGRRRGIPHQYEGDAKALLQDLSTWASVPVGLTRHGPFEEVVVPEDTDDISPRRREIAEGARALTTGTTDVGDLWALWHRNVVALVADGPLEGTYRELSLGLRAWEEAEGDERYKAEERVREIAQRFRDDP